MNTPIHHAATTALAGLVLLVGCANWIEVRTDAVVPLNQLVHHRYHETLRDGDVEGFVDLHTPDGRDAAHREADRLLGRFEKVEHTACVIEAVDRRPEGDERDVLAVFCLEGIGTDGVRRTLEERHRLRCRRGAEGWQIVSVEVVDTEDWRLDGPAFVESALETGLGDAEHCCRGVIDRNGETHPYLGGSGLALADVDGDGDDDLLIVNGNELLLYVNQFGVFQEAAAARGLVAPTEGECRFGVFGDLENDGDVDLVLGVLGVPIVVYVNDGRGRFTARSGGEIGIASTGEATGAAFADFDLDGDLDLFVANGGNLLVHAPEPVFNARNAERNQLFLNRGDGTFVDASADAGIDDRGWALACTISDYDLDGDPDVFVANDFGQDMLYRNRGDATFEEVAEESGVHHHGASMGAAFGDVDGDGHPDLFVSAMASNWRWIIFQPGFPAPAPWPISWVLRDKVLDILGQMMHGNRLYRNRGDGTFVEVSTETDTYHSGWSWGGVFLDYDNDGWLDIYVLNGYITGEDAQDL